MLGLLFGVGRVELEELRPGGPARRLAAAAGTKGASVGLTDISSRPAWLTPSGQGSRVRSFWSRWQSCQPSAPRSYRAQRALFSGAAPGTASKALTNSRSPIRTICALPEPQNIPEPLLVTS